MNDFLLTAVGPWWFLWAILVAVLGVGRWSRLVTYDQFPPAAWWRQTWTDLVSKKHEAWVDLFFCPWCFTPWLMLVCIGTFFLSFTALWIAWLWWLFWGWGALSYIASIVLAYDEPAQK